MKKSAVSISGATAFLAAFPAYAAEGSGTGISLLGSFMQMIASLAVVIGVIFLFSHFANKWLKNAPAAGVQRYIRLVETRHLGPKKSLMLVEVAGEYLLLGNTADGVQLIKQIDMLEEIEVIEQPETMWGERGLRSMVEKAAAAIRSRTGRTGVSRDVKSSPCSSPAGEAIIFSASAHGRPTLSKV